MKLNKFLLLALSISPIALNGLVGRGVIERRIAEEKPGYQEPLSCAGWRAKIAPEFEGRLKTDIELAEPEELWLQEKVDDFEFRKAETDAFDSGIAGPGMQRVQADYDVPAENWWLSFDEKSISRGFMSR